MFSYLGKLLGGIVILALVYQGGASLFNDFTARAGKSIAETQVPTVTKVIGMEPRVRPVVSSQVDQDADSEPGMQMPAWVETTVEQVKAHGPVPWIVLAAALAIGVGAYYAPKARTTVLTSTSGGLRTAWQTTGAHPYISLTAIATLALTVTGYLGYTWNHEDVLAGLTFAVDQVKNLVPDDKFRMVEFGLTVLTSVAGVVWGVRAYRNKPRGEVVREVPVLQAPRELTPLERAQMDILNEQVSERAHERAGTVTHRLQYSLLQNLSSAKALNRQNQAAARSSENRLNDLNEQVRQALDELYETCQVMPESERAEYQKYLDMRRTGVTI
jgi:hypothetical protein